MKKLKGARFRRPERLRELTNAIGRGWTVETRMS